MAFCRVVLSLLVVSVISCYASKVPVFLWGDSLKSSIKSNPLTTYTREEFAAVLKQVLVGDPVTVVFSEETLSVEDFSRKNEDGETSFPYLHDSLDEAVYLPTVKDALPTLNRTAGPDAVNIYSDDFVPIGARFVFVNLNDAREGESRADMLRRHDALMQDTISKLPEDTNFVAVYTANYPSWTIPVSKSRVRRDAEGAMEGLRNSRAYTLDGLRMVVSSIEVKTDNATRVLGTISDHSSLVNDTYVNATLIFDNTTLLLNFNSREGYWFLDAVVMTIGSFSEALFPEEDEIYAGDGFSYRCGQYVTYSTIINKTMEYSVSFVDLKVQPFFETNTTQEFGESYNCVGFFSIPIWSSLFVVFTLLAITLYGIMMIMDIKTMDRFDDPKGKTITINALE